MKFKYITTMMIAAGMALAACNAQNDLADSATENVKIAAFADPSVQNPADSAQVSALAQAPQNDVKPADAAPVVDAAPANINQPETAPGAENPETAAVPSEIAEAPAENFETAAVPAEAPAENSDAADAPAAADNAEVPVAAENPEAAALPVAADNAEVPVVAENPEAVDAPAGDVPEAPAVAADSGAHRINSQDPLSDEQKRILDTIVWDADPEVLNAVEQKNEGGHFLYSDELHPELFRKSIENLGGTYIGVGTDQGYMFIGWQRPTLAFLIDYDPWVVVLHRVYFELWKTCDDGDCILNFFQDKAFANEYLKRPEIAAAGINPKIAHEIYRSGARFITRELRNAKKMSEKTFMNDPETFQYIKSMILSGRIRTFQANLLGDRAFNSIKEALNALGASVTTLYTSNAEQYWSYSKQFKENMLGLPYAEGALVMRTSASKPSNGDYRYSVQPFPVFRAWLEHPKGTSVNRITRKPVIESPDQIPFTVDDHMPPEPKKNSL